MYSYGIQHYTVGYLLAQALVAVALIDARAVAAQFLVGAGAAVVGVLRAVDAVMVGRAVTPVRPGHVLAGGTVLHHIDSLRIAFLKCNL